MGFADSYKRYDPKTEGFGNASQWRRSFKKRMSKDEAATILDEDDPWVVLGLRQGSSKAEIKKAYRELALKWHPDRNQGNEAYCTEMMKKINAAYSLLIYWS